MERQTRLQDIMVIVGTRPEAIKMAPVMAAITASAQFRPVLVSTGQHRELLHGALRDFGLVPDVDLQVMSAAQSPSEVLVRVIDGLTAVMRERQPFCVLLQGDTTTVLGAALAAYYLKIPVGHVEAGLRTYDQENPFPEEANRQLTDRLSRWLFAPTENARRNLMAERIEEARISVTGNTVIDALVAAVGRSSFHCPPDTLLITLHRRESFGMPMREILLGIRDFLQAHPGARALWPVHPNPAVAAGAREVLQGMDSVQMVPPMGYLEFAGALATCRAVLTDSGGLQEEGPSLGKTILVARETTERPEAVESGLNRLVGRSRAGVRDGISTAWSEPSYRGGIPAPSPFGDGRAAERIVAALSGSL